MKNSENKINFLASLALPTDIESFIKASEFKKTPSVRKNKKEEFFCVCPECSELPIVAVMKAEDKGFYVLTPIVASHVSLKGEWNPYQLFLCKSLTGGYFVFPVKVSDGNRTLDKWSASIYEIITENRNRWMRVISVLDDGKYTMKFAEDTLEMPEWPEAPEEIISEAVEAHLISNLDHPYLKTLRGKA
jgi:hypothetical protein